MKQASLANHDRQENGKEARFARIVAAALEVFSEFSFEDATTEEIARRARVSKRDIYAQFPDKHALLIETLNQALQTEISNIELTIKRAEKLPSRQRRLEAIGLAMVNELLSPAMSVLTRLVAAESINRPLVGVVYFENGAVRRTRLISDVLSRYGAPGDKPSSDTTQAAEHFLALVIHRPALTTSVGMQDLWNATAKRAHVLDAVRCFIRAYPEFA